MRVGMLEVRRSITALIAATAIVACSGGDDEGGTTEPTPAIDITVAPATQTVIQGQTASVTVTLTRSGGFTGDVTLAVTGLTANLTAPNVTIASGSTTGVVTYTAGATAATGTANTTITATGTGVTAKTAAVAVTVNAAPTPSFTMTVTPATQSINQGSNVTVTVNLTRTNGFTGTVNLTATGLPNGVTAAFDPAAATGNTSTLTLTASATATTGPATVTVTGTSGTITQTATVALTVNAPAAAGYTLAASAATVTAGATGTSNITITRTGGFADAVTLAVTEGLPTGVTAAFAPNNTTTNASVLTLTAAANATPGTATITVKGTAAGQTEKTATFQLTVAAAAGSYTLALAPSTLPVQQGASGNTTVNITRTGGFAGTVDLAATGLPNGVTAAFNPAAATANTSTLTLTASATATTGPATVTVTGTSGTITQTATLALTVSAAVGGSGNTTYEFCTAGETPVWFAVQDGAPNGNWVRVTGTGTKYQFNVTQAKAAVAYVTNTAAGSVAVSGSEGLAAWMSATIQRELLYKNPRLASRATSYAARSLVDSFQLTMVYGSQAELNTNGSQQCLPGAGKTVNGSVAGIGGIGQSAAVSLGPKFELVLPSDLNFSLKDVPDGALDLIATRQALDLTAGSTTVDKLIIRRGLNQANNSTITPSLDFNAAEAVAPATPALTVTGLGGEAATSLSFYFTSTGSLAGGAPLFFGGLPSTGPLTYVAVPANKQVAGDLHLVMAAAVPNPQTFDQFRYGGLYFKDPIARTVALGPALTTPVVTAAATAPYVRFRATAGIQTEYNKSVLLDFAQSNATADRNVTITALAGYLSGLTTYDFTLPDFTGVAGWDNNWGPKAGAETIWSVDAYGYSGIGFGSANPLEGATQQGARRSSQITP